MTVTEVHVIVYWERFNKKYTIFFSGEVGNSRDMWQFLFVHTSLNSSGKPWSGPNLQTNRACFNNSMHFS